MTKLLIILSIVGMTMSTLSARTIKAIFMKASKSAPKSLYLYNVVESADGERVKGEPVKVLLPRRNLSDGVTLPKGNLKLVVLSSLLSEEVLIPAEAQRILIPATWKNTTAVVIPDYKNKSFPGEMLVTNSSDENLPKGSTLVMNLSKVLLKGEFGSEKLVVKPEESGKFSAPISKSGAYPTTISCFLPNDKREYVIFRGDWIHNSGVRKLVFVLPTSKKTPRLWSVTDRRD